MPNTADSASVQSVALATAILDQVGVPSGATASDDPSTFEATLRRELQAELAAVGDHWTVDAGSILRFEQYRHLRHLDELVDADPFLSSQIGRDYLISADVTVSIETPPIPSLPATVMSGLSERWGVRVPPVLDIAPRFLHAMISLKWSIRSDRVQNIRHESVIMTRTRRGRQPHLGVVTLEPLPTRVASIARGTGEIDAVYHLLYEELWNATMSAGTPDQRSVLYELVENGRLRPWSWLVPTIVAA